MTGDGGASNVRSLRAGLTYFPVRTLHESGRLDASCSICKTMFHDQKQGMDTSCIKCINFSSLIYSTFEIDEFLTPESSFIFSL